MRKLFVVLTILALSACSNKYLDAGYSKEEYNKIKDLSEKNQIFFESYDEKLALLLDNENFEVNNFETYYMFINFLDGDALVENVNDGSIGSFNYALVKRLSKVDDFDSNNLKKYLDKAKYVNDASTVVKLVNDNLRVNIKLVNEFLKDEWYLVRNLANYIKYYSNEKTIRENIEYVNTYNYLTYFEDGEYADPEKYGYQVNVNKFFYLGEDYNPDDLVDLASEQGYGSLRKEAYDAFVKMQKAAKEDGISFYATSSYRSYSTQVKIYNSYLAIDPQEKVDIYSARPGFSDHQTGLTVDILKSGYDFGNFYKSDASKWLLENAYKYGFICRYPEGKDNVTGYEYEPWHYRYVGDVAEDVYNSGLSYDEYFEVYIRESE